MIHQIDLMRSNRLANEVDGYFDLPLRLAGVGLVAAHFCLPRFALLETHFCLPRFALLETLGLRFKPRLSSWIAARGGGDWK